MRNIAYLSIGSNLGDRLETFRKAFQLLSESPHIKLVSCSSLYETDPIGYEDQDCFLNAVLKVKTDLEPEQLLHACMKIEQDLGRKREIRWGPRTLDLDIFFSKLLGFFFTHFSPEIHTGIFFYSVNHVKSFPFRF